MPESWVNPLIVLIHPRIWYSYTWLLCSQSMNAWTAAQSQPFVAEPDETKKKCALGAVCIQRLPSDTGHRGKRFVNSWSAWIAPGRSRLDWRQLDDSPRFHRGMQQITHMCGAQQHCLCLYLSLCFSFCIRVTCSIFSHLVIVVGRSSMKTFEFQVIRLGHM